MSIDTIYALSSGVVPSGVAVVRVSGSQAAHALKSITGSIGAPRQMFHVKHSHPVTNEMIDDGLTVWFPAPQSFTGEDVVEFQIHGGRACVEGLLDALGSLDGCRLAEPGEFTRRAFENGKLDLTEAEAVGDLIAADTSLQRRQALRQLGGQASHIYDGWRTELLHCCALAESQLDFSDEGDVAENVSRETLLQKVRGLITNIEEHLNDGRRGEMIRDGLHVVIAGVPNSGKSSLFNLLANNEAAIVSDIAGTTRDSLSVLLDIDGMAVKLTDTAGLRESADVIEQEGVKRSYLRAGEADVLIWLIDGTNPVLAPPDDLPQTAHLLKVWNKVDVSRETFLTTHGKQSLDVPDVKSAPVKIQVPQSLSITASDDQEARNWHSTCALACPPSNHASTRGEANKRREVASATRGNKIVSRETLIPLSAKDGEGVDGLLNALKEVVAAGCKEAPLITRARHREHLEQTLDHLQSFMDDNSGLPELRAEDLRLAADQLGRITGRLDVEEVLGAIFSQFCIGK